MIDAYKLMTPVQREGWEPGSTPNALTKPGLTVAVELVRNQYRIAISGDAEKKLKLDTWPEVVALLRGIQIVAPEGVKA